MLVRIIFRNNLTWDADLFTSSYFNECLQFNLKKSSLKGLLSIKELKELKTEVINNEFGLTTPQTRRARRITDQKRKPDEIEKNISSFI